MIRKACVFVGRYLLSIVGFLYAATLGLGKRNNREILHEVLFRLGWRERPKAEPNLPPLEIPRVKAADVIGPSPEIRLLEPDSADGNVSGYELAVINSLLASRKVATCFEIGTFDGRTTLNLAAHVGEGGRVVTIDLPPTDVDSTDLKIATGDEKFIVKAESGARYKGTPEAARIIQVFGDSATFDYTPYLGSMDMVFIDGAHSADYVVSDTEKALALLKPGRGLLLWHDYSSPHWKDLTRAMNRLHGEARWRGMRHIEGTTLVMWER